MKRWILRLASMYLCMVGVILYRLGRYKAATTFCTRAIEINSNFQQAWFYCGVCCYKQLEFAMAINCFERAIETEPIFSRISLLDQVWNNRGVALGSLGRYEEAINSFECATEINCDLHSAWSNLGNYLCKSHMHEKAISAYRKAVKIKPDCYQTLNNWGFCLDNFGNHEEAIVVFKRAIKINPKSYITMFGLGLSLTNLYMYEEAIIYLNHARILSPDVHEISQVLGIALYEVGRKKEAIATFDQVLADKPDNQQTKALRWCFAGQWALDQKDLVSAAAAFNLSIASVEVIRSEEIDIQQRENILSRFIEVYFQLIQTYIDLNQHDKAIEIVDRSKARNLVELMAVNDLYPKGNIPEKVKKELERLRREIAILESFPNRSNPRLNYDDDPTNSRGIRFTKSEESDDKIRQKKPVELSELKQNLEKLLEEKILPIDPDFALTQKVTPLSFAEISETIPDDNTAIISWHITETKVMAFLLSRKLDQPIYISYGEESREELETVYGHYSYCLNNEDLSNALQEIAKALNINEMLNKIQKVLPGCDKLIMVPHGLLHLLPLDALPIKNGLEGKECLKDYFDRGITFAPSFSILKLVQSRTYKKPESFFGIQNPGKNLPFTDYEVPKICQIFNPHSILKHKEATKEKVIDFLSNNISGIDILHTACHGHFDTENFEYSGLILAGAAVSDEVDSKTEPGERSICLRSGGRVSLDKCLSLIDIFNLDLRQTFLVVSSACETGLSQANITDEYVGLPSAFLFAGVQTLVVSLWRVNDFATSLIMIRFFENFKQKGMSVSASLKDAQNWLRNATKETILTEIQNQLNKLNLDYQKSQTLDEQATRLEIALDEQKTKIEKSNKDRPFADSRYWAAFICISGER